MFAKLTLPDSQLVQDTEPSDEACFPIEQLEHDSAPLVAYLPGEHGLQEVEAVIAPYFPAEQVVQEVEAVTLYVPLGHVVQPVLPVPVE
jgi:hypothetical protein